MYIHSLNTKFLNMSVTPETLRRCLCRTKKGLETDNTPSGCAWRQVTALPGYKLGMPTQAPQCMTPCRPHSDCLVMPLDSQELGGLSEEILRRQKIIEEQLAELEEITGRLTPEEQQDLVEAVKQKDADADKQREQVCCQCSPIQNNGVAAPVLCPQAAILAVMS